MNFTPRDTFLLTLCTTAILAGASQLVPPDGAILGLHRVDVFSDLRSDAALCETAGYVDVDQQQEYPEPQTPSIPSPIPTPTTAKPQVIAAPNEVAPSKEIKPATVQPKIDSAAKLIPITSETIQPEIKKTVKERKIGAATTQKITEIEDFTSAVTLKPFYDKLRNINSLGRPVRVAVLGDSFIEGDIFTQDLREILQTRFGGSGVGFVPMASSVSGFRQTVEHKFSGWASHCITSNMRRGGYIISSYTFTPSDGNSVSYKGSKSRAHLNHFSRVRLLFVNKGSSKIKASVNDESDQIFTPSSSGDLQQLVLRGDSIGTVRFSILSPDGFTGYGTFMDAARGVSVDNYSVRGNSGITLSSTDGGLMQQMNTLLPYDLIIFEYGLNVAQADVRNYSTYLAQMQVAIGHLRRSFPQAAILIMSVPDRARRTADGLVTMPGISAMEQTQRTLAERSGAAFWSTLSAMQTRGGMGEFVKKGWAAKDYTHLSHRGGKELARALCDALMLQMNDEQAN